MSIVTYLPSVLSTLFRLAVYIFLRIIPTSLAQFVLPPLYITHILSSWLFAPQPLHSTPSEKAVDARTVPQERPLRTLILSLPTTSRRLRLFNVLINTLLLGAVVDFVVTPFLDTATDVTFTRVGAVYPDSVKIVTRYKELNATEDDYSLRMLFREAKGFDLDSAAWSDGPIVTFKPDNDWVATTKLTGLWPNTSYEYTFSTPNRTLINHPASPIRFRTFPDPRLPTGNHFRFIATSCLIPNHPYNGPLHRKTIKGFDLLADYLYPDVGRPEIADDTDNSTERSNNISAHLSERSHSSVPVEFLLFLGDFIYADVPVYIGDDKEAYRRLYRRNYQSDSFRKIYERLPIFHAYDDHEFKNNFGAAGNDSTPPFLNAASAFKTYNSDANYNSASPGEHYFEFQFGDTAFFVMDTRRHRTEVGATNRTMLGENQLASLQAWLARVNETSVFKFVITSVPFTSLWGHDAQLDSWAGFPGEKQILLDSLHSVPNVILLSGDRHEFAAIEFNSAGTDRQPLWEFSTSPLSMFYIPFIRTLQPQSQVLVRQNKTIVQSVENGTEILTFTEDVPAERVIKYIPEGNYKWSAIEINTMDAKRPTVSLEVMVDGQPSFKFEIIGTPVKLQSSTALTSFVPNTMKDMFERLGFHPSKWF